MICPVCLSRKYSLYDQDKFRSFYLCDNCELIFISRDKILPAIEEMKRYEAHENSESDIGYQSYLNQIVDACLAHLSPKASGLDFGCGKTNLVSQIFSKSGHTVDSYDVFFHPSEYVWQKKYDFIVLSEVIEHLSGPRSEMEKLSGLLKEKGMVFIKTKFHPNDPLEFANWFYKRDQTHVQFFNLNSMKVLAKHLGLSEPQEVSKDLYLLKSY